MRVPYLLGEFWQKLARDLRTAYTRNPSRMKVSLFFGLPFQIIWLVFPAFIATQHKPRLVLVLIAALLYAVIWLNMVNGTIAAMLGLYGFRVKNRLFQETETEERKMQTVRVATRTMLSFIYTVYAFALAYVFASHADPLSFNVGSLDLFSGVYFSLTTIATVGYGDIVPHSTAARLLVMTEIVVGMFYAIFIFSVIASFAREKK